jgi:hypothetical protein
LPIFFSALVGFFAMTPSFNACEQCRTVSRCPAFVGVDGSDPGFTMQRFYHVAFDVEDPFVSEVSKPR